MKNIHKIWHDFNKFVTAKLGLNSVNDINFSGYDIIEQIENYVNTNKQIKLIWVYDSVHASSIILLVPHPTFGITILYVPQCTTHQNEFFLYQQNRKTLMSELQTMSEWVYEENKL